MQELQVLLPRMRAESKDDRERMDDFNDDLERMFRRLTRKMRVIFPQGTVRGWATAMVIAISGISRNQIRTQVKVATDDDIGPLFTEDRELGEYLSNRVDENVGLITSIPESRLTELKNNLIRMINDDATRADIQKMIQEEFGKGRSKANLIARDQVNKLNGQINEARLKSIGVTRYRWRTAKDERVRSRHAALEGKAFTWKKAPKSGTKGERLHPGQDFQCRCYAEPILDDLL